MKSIEEFLSDLRRNDIHLWAEGERLRYKAPPQTLTPTLLQELKERKAEILAFLHNANTATHTNLPPILPAPRDKDLPLSFAQQRLWFLDQLEPNSSAYNMPAAYRLTGQLNITALEQSLNEIIQRHEILRTTFPSASAEIEPQQIIAAEIELTLPILDLQKLPANQKQTKAQQIATEYAQRPFNLANETLFRCQLLRLSNQEHILLLNLHHIVFDGWSYNTLLQELTTLYQTYSTNQPSPLPQLTIQYADFAHWQRNWLQGKELDSQLSYWKQQLGGTLPILQLPTDYPRPSTQNHQGAKQTLKLSQTLTIAIKTLSQKEGATLFMTLLATYQTLLHRHTQQDDIIIGTPIAGRNQIETENLIGLFLNNLAIRTNLSGNPTFRQLLTQVRQVTLAAYNHQDVSFEKLVEELQPERSLSRHPIFDVMLNFNNTPQTTFNLPGLTITPFLELNEPESKFSMTLYVQEQDNQLNLTLVYQKALFSAERIASVLHQFQYLLEQIVATPNHPIHSYSLVTSQSRSLLPNPHLPLPEPEYELIPHRFNTWANQTPKQIAICQGSHTWTYQQLSQRAQAIAQILITYGIKPGNVVAVSGHPSFGLIASMLGILESGGVLLTLDQKLPQQRQQLMLTTAQAKCLLYVGKQEAENKDIRELLDIISINPNNGKAESQKPHIQNHQPLSPISLDPNAPAYLFFTSGTTGIPKGVLGTHKGLAHFLHWQQQTFNIQTQDRIAQLTGLSFDVILREIFLPLTSGATLCLLEPSADLTPASIFPWLERQRISVLHTVPTLAQTWLTNLPSRVSLKTLRWVFFAGEPLPEKLVRQWRESLPETSQIVNLYGPTETTLAKCYYLIPNQILPGIQPIGVPLPETQALVVKENHQLCGIGEPGEIVIRTPFCTLGYINATQENHSRFVSNPFRDDKKDLLYHTGDRGRYRPDGSLDILGRLDHQVKIRGVRIEPTEIETLLGQNPDVRETVVMARNDPSGDKYLVAYIVPHPNLTPTISQLRGFLQQKLPTYMIPGAFIVLDTLPLTPNGKIDRSALPTPEQIQPEPTHTFIAPRDELELQLTQIWEKVLGKKPISVNDNFFDLGGHSLLAVRLFAQIEKTFGKTLPLATLFQAATIEELANIFRQSGYSPPWQALVAIKPGDSKPPLFCIHPSGGNVLCYQTLAHYLGEDQPVYGLQAVDLDDTQTPYKRLEDVAAHHIKEIQTLQPSGPYLLAGHSSAGIIAFEIAQQLVAQGEKVALLALLDAHSTQVLRHDTQPLRTLYIHLHNLIRLRPQDKLTYIQQRAGWLRGRMTRKITKIVNQWQGHSLPENSQPYSFIREAFYQAVRDYVPQVYPGSATIFRTKHQITGVYYDPQLGWGSLVAGGLEIIDVPGLHLTLLTEPDVQVLAEKLKACINRVSADTKIEVKNPIIPSFQPEELGSYSSLVPIQPNGSKPPLFFTNSIGAAKTLATFLSSEQPVYGLSIFGLPEMDNNQLSSLRIEYIAEQFIQDMRHIQPEGPYFIAAYCGDARIAFEMAQQLYAQGQKVARLAFIDVAWNPENLGTSLYWQNFNQLGFEYLIKKIKGRLNGTRKRIIRKINKIQEEFNRKIDDNSKIKIKHQKLLQAFYQASLTYVPQTYPGQITLFLSREWRLKNSPELANLADGGLETQEIPGYHNFLFEEPYIQVLAEKIQACIDTAQATLSESNSTISHPSTTTGIQTKVSLPNQAQESVFWSSLVPIQSDGTKPPIFCIHPAVVALYYCNLARYLDPERPFYVLQLDVQSEQQASQNNQTVENMAANYISQMRTLQPTGPYWLLGNCFGGIIAFEMARQLHAQGEQVALLALFDATAPGAYQRQPLLERFSGHCQSLLQFGANYILQKVTGKVKQIKNRLNKNLQKITFQVYHSMGHPLPKSLSDLPRQAVTQPAYKKYIPQTYPGKVTLFHTHKSAPSGWSVDPQMGWGKLAGGGLEIYEIPGTHASMFQEPHVQVLAEKLHRCLEKLN